MVVGLISGFSLANRSVAETSTRETKHRTQIYYASGPRGVNTPSSETKTKGLQGSYTWTGMINQICRFAGARVIAKSRTRMSEMSSSF